MADYAWKASGWKIPIRTDADGVPLCPCVLCGSNEQMVEQPDGSWMCPTWAVHEQFMGRLVEEIERAFTGTADPE